MKYVDTAVVFSEIPDEVTLAINISECPIRCPDCHSKYLWENIGKALDESSLDSLINNNEGISCVCLMGGDANIEEVMHLLKHIKRKYPSIKTAWYSGKDLSDLPNRIDLSSLDFLKTGPYRKEFGPLTSKHTNQRFYVIRNVYGKHFLMDETFRFFKKKAIE